MGGWEEAQGEMSSKMKRRLSSYMFSPLMMAADKSMDVMVTLIITFTAAGCLSRLVLCVGEDICTWGAHWLTPVGLTTGFRWKIICCRACPC